MSKLSKYFILTRIYKIMLFEGKIKLNFFYNSKNSIRIFYILFHYVLKKFEN